MWGGMICQICFWILVDFLPLVVTRWLTIRFKLFSSVVVGVTGLVCLVTPSISASTAGFALTFASTITNDLTYLVCFEWDADHFKVKLLLGQKICRT